MQITLNKEEYDDLIDDRNKLGELRSKVNLIAIVDYNNNGDFLKNKRATVKSIVLDKNALIDVLFEHSSIKEQAKNLNMCFTNKERWTYNKSDEHKCNNITIDMNDTTDIDTLSFKKVYDNNGQLQIAFGTSEDRNAFVRMMDSYLKDTLSKNIKIALSNM